MRVTGHIAAVLALMLTACAAYTQPSRDGAADAALPIFVEHDLRPAAAQALGDRVDKYYILGGWAVGGPAAAPGTWSRIDYVLRNVIPKDWDGPIIIDREGDATMGQVEQWTDKAAKELQYRSEIVARLRAARPRAKIGDYAMVTTKDAKQWGSPNPPPEFLAYLAKLDMICPHFYDWAPGPTTEREIAWARIADAIGERLGKPVYAFFWHRWHGAHPKHGYELVNESEYIQHIQTLRPYIDGVFAWWREEYWFANPNGAKNEAWYTKHTPTKPEFDAWADNRRRDVLRWTAEALTDR